MHSERSQTEAEKSSHPRIDHKKGDDLEELLLEGESRRYRLYHC